MLVLWQPGDPWRERLWAFCRSRWEDLGLRVVEGRSARGLFAARNEAARAAGAWDVALFADADIALAVPQQALEALERAAEGGYVAAFTTLAALSEAGTRAILAGAGFEDAEAEKTHHGSWVGCFAIGRPLFDELGGYDERFAPYSGQDVAIIQAAATLARLERVPGLAVHLWHPRGGAQPGHPPSHPTLAARYETACGDEQAMRELLAR